MTEERVRFTIAVDGDVHDAFAALAHSRGVSLSRCIGEWLRDTAESAQMVTMKINDARRSPAEAMHVFLRDAIVPGMDDVRRKNPHMFPPSARAEGARSADAGARPKVPPSSNTGGKSPGKTRRNTP
jgi:hypothetical protein